MGLVCGAFEEVSEKVHELVDVMAKRRVQMVGLRDGMFPDRSSIAVTNQYFSTVVFMNW